jgi:L-fucose isomerase-like protein
VTRLSHDELCNAAFDLGLDVEGVTDKGEIARRLLDHLDDRGKMDLLRRWLEVNGRQDLLAEGENR